MILLNSLESLDIIVNSLSLSRDFSLSGFPRKSLLSADNLHLSINLQTHLQLVVWRNFPIISLHTYLFGMNFSLKNLSSTVFSVFVMLRNLELTHDISAKDFFSSCTSN